MAITGTYNLSADPIWRQLPLQEVYLECDTSTAPVTINLFPVSDLQRFWNVKIYITDISNNAGTNPITINAGFSGVPLVQDTINRQGYTNFNIDYNGGDAVLIVTAENKWAVFSQTYVQSYSLIQEESVSLPQRNVLNFTGAGVTAFDNAGKTEVNVSGVSSGNFGIYSQTAQSIPVTNTIVETTLLDGGVGTLSVPPNGFNVGDSFVAIMTGHLNSANNQQLEIRIRSNGSILANTGSLTISAATNKNFNLQIYFTIQSIGGVGVASIITGGNFAYTKNAGSALEGTAFSTANNTTFNTTVLNTLLITAQWGASNPNNSIYSEIFTLTKTF